MAESVGRVNHRTALDTGSDNFGLGYANKYVYTRFFELLTF